MLGLVLLTSCCSKSGCSRQHSMTGVMLVHAHRGSSQHSLCTAGLPTQPRAQHSPHRARALVCCDTPHDTTWAALPLLSTGAHRYRSLRALRQTLKTCCHGRIDGAAICLLHTARAQHTIWSLARLAIGVGWWRAQPVCLCWGLLPGSVRPHPDRRSKIRSRSAIERVFSGLTQGFEV